MALVVKDRVQETTTTTGTGTVTLAGAVSGFQSFSAIGNGNTTYYAIVGTTEWELGIGTYTSSGTTLSRTTVLSSSNSGSLVNFSAGAKNVFCTYSAVKAVGYDTPSSSTGSLSLPVGSTGDRPTGAAGMIRYNTTTGNPEWYDSAGAQWLFLSQPATLSVTAFLWGGGGGGGYFSGAGGGSGSATGTFTAGGGSSFAVVVGGGGSSQAPNAGPGSSVPGGGGLTGNLGYGGQGGGYSGVFITSASQANAYLIAGGGGGAAYEGAAGGAGGGTTGVAGGSGGNAGGGGGTQSAGGTSVSSAGTALQGGSSGSEGDGGGSGGGGGGYYGGGAGSNTNPGSAGGGGSGYFNPTYIINATLYQGSGTTPGNSSDSLRNGSGNGGASGNNAGTAGRVVIRYLGVTARATGGTITNDGTYTYHTFTTAGTFTVTS
jgi:hypothetical protein